MKILGLELKNPDIELLPAVQLQIPSSKIGICGDLMVKVVKYINDGHKGFKDLEWSLIKTNSTN